MGAANDRLRDLILADEARLGRISRRELRRFLPILIRAQREVGLRLEHRLRVAATLGLDRGPLTTARLRVILEEALATLQDAYRQVGESLPARLVRIAERERLRTEALLREAVPPEIEWESFDIPESAIRQIATTNVLGGQTLDAWLGTGRKSLAAREVRRYRKVIREVIQTGLLTGDPVETMVRQIRARGATVARNALRFVVDSATKETMQGARLATFKANGGPQGVVKGFQWLSTIDLRTTKEWCIPRDLKLYDLDFQPIRHSIPWGAGPGAIHPRCRSTMTAVLKSWREMGLPFREVGRTTRASMDGRVSASRSVIDRLASPRTPLKELVRVFGVKRARLVYDAGTTIDARREAIQSLYDAKGRLIPVEELAAAA